MIRREPIYISTDVWKACWLIAKARSAPASEETGARIETADAIADELLRATIKEKYPTLLDYFKKADKLEKETIKEIGKANDTNG